jgi:hypothetical protein
MKKNISQKKVLEIIIEFKPKLFNTIEKKNINYQYGLIAQDYGRNTRQQVRWAHPTLRPYRTQANHRTGWASAPYCGLACSLSDYPARRTPSDHLPNTRGHHCTFGALQRTQALRFCCRLACCGWLKGTRTGPGRLRSCCTGLRHVNSYRGIAVESRSMSPTG